MRHKPAFVFVLILVCGALFVPTARAQEGPIVQGYLLALLELESRVGVRPDRRGSVPAIWIGDEYTTYALLIGQDEIEAYLGPAIEWFMDLGGVGLPG